MMRRAPAALRPVFTVLLLAVLLVGAGCGGDGSPGPDPGDDFDNPPDPPGTLSVTGQVGGVTLSWEGVTASDLAGYNVYRATESFSSIANRAPLNDAPVADTAFRDDTADTGTTYYYRVAAVDEGDNQGNPSNQITVTVFPAPPSRP